MNYRFACDEWNEVQWRALTAGLDCQSIYQTWHYAELHSRGPLRRVSRAAVLTAGRPVVAAHFRIKRLPLLGVGVTDMDYGPLMALGDSDLEEAFKGFLDGVRAEYCGRRNHEARLWLRSTWDSDRDARLVKILQEHRFRHDPTVRAYHTYLIDLRPDLTTLRAKLHGKWRNQLNVAERAGLTLESGRAVELFDRFYRLYAAMWRVKRFPTGVRVPLMRDLQLRLPDHERFYIAVAVAGARDVAATVCATIGDTVLYFLGASDPEERHAGRPGYLLQWHNMQHARERGFRWYDTGGYNADDNPSVTQFKSRMGGTPVVFPGCFVAPAVRGTPRVYRAAERAYQKARHMAIGR